MNELNITNEKIRKDLTFNYNEKNIYILMEKIL